MQKQQTLSVSVKFGQCTGNAALFTHSKQNDDWR